MRVTVQGKEFASAITLVSKVFNRSIQQADRFISLIIYGANLHVVARSHCQTVLTSVRCEGDLKTHADVRVSAIDLQAHAEAFKTRADVQLTSDDEYLVVQWGNISLRFNLEPVGDTASTVKQLYKSETLVQSKDLQAAVNYAVKAIGKEVKSGDTGKKRTNLHHCQIVGDGAGVAVNGTNGNRLHTTLHECTSSKSFDALIPVSTAVLLPKIFGKSSLLKFVKTPDNSYAFVDGNAALIFNSAAVSYPDVRRVSYEVKVKDVTKTVTAVVNPAQLLSAVKRACVIANGDVNYVSFTLDRSALTLNPGSHGVYKVNWVDENLACDATADGDVTDAVFDAQYIADALEGFAKHKLINLVFAEEKFLGSNKLYTLYIRSSNISAVVAPTLA